MEPFLGFHSAGDVGESLLACLRVGRAGHLSVVFTPDLVSSYRSFFTLVVAIALVVLFLFLDVGSLSQSGRSDFHDDIR